MNKLKLLRMFLLVCIVVNLLLCIFSYHDNNDYTNIKEITYVNYLGNYEEISYTDMNDIKKIVRRMRCINFYPQKNSLGLQESPTRTIRIKYKDSTEKVFSFAGFNVMIYNNNLIDKNAMFYYVNPICIKFVLS